MNLLTWAAHARPGDSVAYFKGDLSYARWRFSSTSDAEERQLLNDLLEPARDAWRLYTSGEVTLVRKRIEPDENHYGQWMYMAQRLA